MFFVILILILFLFLFLHFDQVFILFIIILFVALFLLVVLFLKVNFVEFLLFDFFFVFKLVLKTLYRLRGREVVTLGSGCYFSRLFGNPLIRTLILLVRFGFSGSLSMGG